MLEVPHAGPGAALVATVSHLVTWASATPLSMSSGCLAVSCCKCKHCGLIRLGGHHLPGKSQSYGTSFCSEANVPQVCTYISCDNVLSPKWELPGFRASPMTCRHLYLRTYKTELSIFPQNLITQLHLIGPPVRILEPYS